MAPVIARQALYCTLSNLHAKDSLLGLASRGSLLDNLFRKPVIYSFYFFKCLLKLSRSSMNSLKCFCDEIVSTLLLVNVLERELSLLLVLFEK